MQPKSHHRQLRPHLSRYFWKRSLSTQTANGVFGHQTRRFSKLSPEWSFLKWPAYRFRVDARKRRWHGPYSACPVRDAILFLFYCGRAKTIRIRYVWTLSFRKRQISLVFKNIRGLGEKAKVTPPPTLSFPRLQRISSSAGSMRQRGDKVKHNPLPQYHREKLQELSIRLLRV